MPAGECIGQRTRQAGHLGVHRPAIALSARPQSPGDGPRSPGCERQADKRPAEQRAYREGGARPGEQHSAALHRAGIAPLAAQGDDRVDETGEGPSRSSAMCQRPRAQ
jgi:hypothetical protein